MKFSPLTEVQVRKCDCANGAVCYILVYALPLLFTLKKKFFLNYYYYYYSFFAFWQKKKTPDLDRTNITGQVGYYRVMCKRIFNSVHVYNRPWISTQQADWTSAALQ